VEVEMRLGGDELMKWTMDIISCILGFFVGKVDLDPSIHVWIAIFSCLGLLWFWSMHMIYVILTEKIALFGREQIGRFAS
jgi:hypothetical protein